MFCLHFSPPTLEFYREPNSRELSHQLILHHHTQTMRFSPLVIVAALTASMSVSACVENNGICYGGSECCVNLYCKNEYCTPVT
ncbi:hypothetical protein K503DRAFT_770940 [Rhizopogon vinicolor AM-OR11-026]|uniref:Uncharacterized protein n=1 Tax=Rhizopogon vinicolor AM-OR11-026 TaxID=1314800 RepID=A0A1B7MZF2_9AGAM|nr:hypothetical protein K503DRAFT_770940 [Rhizopogon vinicolor AM-OR11-026]